jgi:hypothetical protein
MNLTLHPPRRTSGGLCVASKVTLPSPFSITLKASALNVTSASDENNASPEAIETGFE